MPRAGAATGTIACGATVAFAGARGAFGFAALGGATIGAGAAITAGAAVFLTIFFAGAFAGFLAAVFFAAFLATTCFFAAFIDGIDRWIADRLHADEANANQNLPRLARLGEVWEKIVRAARDTETYNLERKPLVFSVFGWLADATR